MAPPRLIHAVKHLVPDLIARTSKGSIVTTECGKQFLDLTTGIGVTNLGHSHPRVNARVAAAVGDGGIVHMQQNVMRHRPMVDLIDRLGSLPFSRDNGLDAWFFWNSGAEAVEASLKLARQATGRQYIVTVNGGYHGRTFGTMPLTTSGVAYRNGFGPLMGGVVNTTFPYVTRGPYGMEESLGWPQQSLTPESYQYWGAAPADVAARDTARCLDNLELMFRTQCSPAETAAVLLEPVLGEGGYVPCPPGFLKGLREICDRHGILLICDEVQTGFGRTGTMFASEWIDGGVRPDILVCAKGIANGFPMSAIATRQDLSIKQTPGGMGGTYCSNAVTCAAAHGVLDAFEQDDVLSNAAARHVDLLQHLQKIRDQTPGFIREIRGAGMMIGIDLEQKVGGPFGSRAAAVQSAALRRGLLTLVCGPYDTLRLIPALTICKEDLAKAMDILSESVKEVAASA